MKGNYEKSRLILLALNAVLALTISTISISFKPANSSNQYNINNPYVIKFTNSNNNKQPFSKTVKFEENVFNTFQSKPHKKKVSHQNITLVLIEMILMWILLMII